MMAFVPTRVLVHCSKKPVLVNSELRIRKTEVDFFAFFFVVSLRTLRLCVKKACFTQSRRKRKGRKVRKGLHRVIRDKLEVESECELDLPVRTQADGAADGRTQQAERRTRGVLRKRLSRLDHIGCA